MAGNTIRVGVQATGVKQASSELDKLKDSVTKGWSGNQIGKGLVQGLGMAGGLGAARVFSGAISKVGDVLGDSIQAASDLNETISKSQVVFGDAAAEVKKFGEGAALSMGMSENAAITAAASIGNLLLSTGTAKEKIAPMSEGLVQLAADLASFNNISMEDALAKLQSGIVGQERPLRELGVAISAASVKAKAAQMGFHAVNGEFTEGEKVQARYALIFEQTSTAQGDFARTSDQLANSQRIVNAELEDASAKIGTQLTPAVTKVENFLAHDFIPTALNTVDVLANVAQSGLKPVADAVAVFDRGAADAIITVIHLNDAVGGIPVPWHKAAEAVRDDAGKMQDDIDSVSTTTKDMVGKIRDDLVTGSGSIVQSSIDVAKASLNLRNKLDQDLNANKRASGEWRDEVIDDARDVIDAAFGKVIDARDLAATNAEITANRLIIASGTSSKAQKDDARGALIQLEQDQANYLLDLAAAGDTGSKTVTDTVKLLMKELASAHGDERKAIQAEIDAWNKLATAIRKVPTMSGRISAAHPGGGGAQEFAEGGVVKGPLGSPQLAIVHGGETVIPTGQGLPSAGFGGSVGGSTTMILNVTVNASPGMSPGAARAIGDAIGPALTSWQQRNGLLTRRATGLTG